MDEKWLPIEGYGDAYSVSDRGRVMRTKPREIYWRRIDPWAKFKPSECRSYINRGGYPQVRIGPSGAQKTVCVHRLVADAFLENPLGLRDVNHIDGDKANNSVDNLEWMTHKSNMRHAVDNGLQRILRGSEIGNSKLSEDNVRSILKDTRPRADIAVSFGVDKTLIGLIQRRKIWRHITD